MRKGNALLPIICFFCFVSAKSQDKWDLRRSVEYALANNISVQQADVQARLAELTLNQNRLSQYPSANLSANTGINSGRSIDPTTNLFTNTQLFSAGFSFQTGMTIFNWFSLRNTIAGNRLDTEAAKANIEKIKNDIALNVATSYLLVVLSQEQVNISEVAVLQTLQNLDNTRKRVEAGALPELNQAELEAQMATDSAALISAKGTVRQNILQLKALLNLDAAVPFEVEMPPLDQIPVESLAVLQPEDVYVLALANLPQQKVNDLRIKAAEKYTKSARGQMYPSISLFAGMGSNYANNKIPDARQIFTGTFDTSSALVNVNGTSYNVLTPHFETMITTYRTPFDVQISDNFRQNIGIQLSIPLFNGSAARTSWERSKLNVKSLQLQKDQDLLTLKQNIYTAYNDAVTALQTYEARKKAVTTSVKSYDFAQKRYELGLLSTIDLLTNQNNLTTARVQMALAHVDYLFKIKLLEFYKGQGLKLQ